MPKQLPKALQEKGHRTTKAKLGLLEVLEQADRPLSAADILKALKKQKIQANLSTIYRELASLGEEGFVNQTTFDKKTRLFERAEEEDHHHAVCNNCNQVLELNIEDELKALEKKISKQTKFKTESHLVEFFGTCRKC